MDGGARNEAERQEPHKTVRKVLKMIEPYPFKMQIRKELS